MGDRIRRLREAKGWSQQRLADELAERGCAITRVAISYWENDMTANIRNRTFRVLVQLLGTDQDYLLFGADRQEGPPASAGKHRNFR